MPELDGSAVTVFCQEVLGRTDLADEDEIEAALARHRSGAKDFRPSVGAGIDLPTLADAVMPALLFLLGLTTTTLTATASQVLSATTVSAVRRLAGGAGSGQCLDPEQEKEVYSALVAQLIGVATTEEADRVAAAVIGTLRLRCAR